jgi:hypothetical protein
MDYLDWSRDDQPELLLQVYGVNDTWFEAVGRGRDGEWRRIFRDRCDEGGRTLARPRLAPRTGAGASRRLSRPPGSNDHPRQCCPPAALHPRPRRAPPPSPALPQSQVCSIFRCDIDHERGLPEDRCKTGAAPPL